METLDRLMIILLVFFAVGAVAYGIFHDPNEPEISLPDIVNSGPESGPEMQAARVGAILASMDPLSAAGVLAAAGWDCLPYGETLDMWIWDAPTTGSPAIGYDVEFRGVSASGTTTFQLWFPGGMADSMRVRGFDVDGRRGPWSEWGTTYVPVVPETASGNSGNRGE